MPGCFLTISIWHKDTEIKNNMKDLFNFLSNFLVLDRYLNSRLTSATARNQSLWLFARNQLLRWYQLRGIINLRRPVATVSNVHHQLKSSAFKVELNHIWCCFFVCWCGVLVGRLVVGFGFVLGRVFVVIVWFGVFCFTLLQEELIPQFNLPS